MFSKEARYLLLSDCIQFGLYNRRYIETVVHANTAEELSWMYSGHTVIASFNTDGKMINDKKDSQTVVDFYESKLQWLKDNSETYIEL
jgi:hypothetical protein